MGNLFKAIANYMWNGETMRWRRQWRQHFVSFSNPNNFIKSAQNFIKLGQKLFMVKERSSLLLFKEFFPQQIKVIITNNSTYNWQLTLAFLSTPSIIIEYSPSYPLMANAHFRWLNVRPLAAAFSHIVFVIIFSDFDDILKTFDI
jgi:hypothetical protein